jgi:hypothetical protein
MYWKVKHNEKLPPGTFVTFEYRQVVQWDSGTPPTDDEKLKCKIVSTGWYNMWEHKDVWAWDGKVSDNEFGPVSP